MAKLERHTGKNDKKHTKIRTSGTKNLKNGSKISKKPFPKYEKTKPHHIEALKGYRDYANKTELNQKYLDEYKGFFDYFLDTFPYLQNKSKDEFVSSKEFKKFFSHIGMLMKQFKEFRNKENPEEFRNKIIKAYTFYQWMKIGYTGLLNTMPIELRAGLNEEMDPKFKIMKGILDGFKQADPKLMKMTKQDLEVTSFDYLDDDSTKSGF